MSSLPGRVRRLAEVDLPIRQISAQARREKSIRHGHISTLHIWWARRPLAACRSVLLASLLPDPVDERCSPEFRRVAGSCLKELRGVTGGPVSEWEDPLALRLALLEFVARFADWDLSADPNYLAASRTLVREAAKTLTGSGQYSVLDPFAGGGAIPLEALRLGTDTHASDLNPLPVLLNRVLLEYVPRFGSKLAEEVARVGAEIGAIAADRLADVYPARSDGVPLVYMWARTILSEAPGDTVPVEIPLLRSMWLSKKKKRKIAIRWVRDGSGNVVLDERTRTFANGKTLRVRQPRPEVFEPRRDSEVEPGTSKGGAATCPVTGHTTPVESVRVQLESRLGGAADARLFAVVVRSVGGDRFYATPEATDLAAFEAAAELMVAKHEHDAAAVPQGQLNHLRGFFNVVLYGIRKWGDIFSPRQALALATFAEVLRDRAASLGDDPPGQRLAVHACIALAFDRLAEKLSSVARWDTSRENPQGTFGRQALPMVWDFCEVNPFSGAGGDWSTALDWVVRVLDHNARSLADTPGTGSVLQASAANHPLPNDCMDAVFTDPPYYSAVPYADLSDFFCSWLHMTLGTEMPDLFTEPLSPKDEELVALSHRAAMYRNKDGKWFEQTMTQACTEARRICRPDGVGIFVFASKDTPAWEAMLSALVHAGWIVTASWPIDTEMSSRLRARNSATLASSIHIVCRPRERDDGSLDDSSIGDWRDILRKLPARMREWLPRLAEEGVIGADAIFSCLGPALELFTENAIVEKVSGERVELREYLEHVWAAVANEALSMMFQGAEATGLSEDARLTAMWLWTLTTGGVGKETESARAAEGEKRSNPASYELEFDAARKIAQGLGVNLEVLDHLVEVKGSTARLRAVDERTGELFGEQKSARSRPRGRKGQVGLFEEIDRIAEEEGWGDLGVPTAMESVLDRVHQAMLLFASGRSNALKRFLADAVAKDKQFWQLGQTLSALYPPGSNEKRWIDGVLARKKGAGFG